MFQLFYQKLKTRLKNYIKSIFFKATKANQEIKAVFNNCQLACVLALNL